jgi:predicted phage tail protein
MIVVCGLIAFANIAPAIAADNSQGMEQLPNIQTKADNAVKSSPYDSNPEYTSHDQSNQGLNEIQGTADFDKMKRTSNEDLPPIVNQAEKAFGKAGDKIQSAKDNTLDKAGDTASYVKDKAGDALNSLTEKVSDTAKAIKNKVKS